MSDNSSEHSQQEARVPGEIIPDRTLPSLTYRDMPSPIPFRKMLGPSIILLGLSVGSGEFVIWPYMTYKYGLVLFWACILGVTTQYFLNMEIERWTLLTGESAVTGFSRLWRHWAWIFLLCNIIPWMWPGWATGGATMLSWFVGGEIMVKWYAIGSLVLIGMVISLGPIVYNTVERLQIVLISVIAIVVIVIFILTVRWDAVKEMARGITMIGHIPPDIRLPALLGALAFAGAGGTMNLCQSHYIREKGYAMGKYIGRITSPITGKAEAISTVGFHFHYTPENMQRWKVWWRRANWEQLITFWMLCTGALVMLCLISYSTVYGMTGLDEQLGFIRMQGQIIGSQVGNLLKVLFYVAGIAILFTTELGVLDAVSRVSTDIVKVSYLRENKWWTESRLYFAFLWLEIALGCVILAVGLDKPLVLLIIAAALNAGVMFIYSILLLYLNNKILDKRLGMHPVRFVAIIWSCAFFGYFTLITLNDQLPRLWEHLKKLWPS